MMPTWDLVPGETPIEDISGLKVTGVATRGELNRLEAENIWLKMHDHPITEWPETHVGAQSTIREEYLDAVREADQGRYGPLRALHQQYTRPT